MLRAHFIHFTWILGAQGPFPPPLDSGALWGRGQKELEMSHSSLLHAPARAGGNLHRGVGIHELLGEGLDVARTRGCYGAFSG